MNTCRPNWRQL